MEDLAEFESNGSRAKYEEGAGHLLGLDGITICPRTNICQPFDRRHGGLRSGSQNHGPARRICAAVDFHLVRPHDARVAPYERLALSYVTLDGDLVVPIRSRIPNTLG